MNQQEIQFLFTLRYNPLRKYGERGVLDFIPGETNSESLENLLVKSIHDLTDGLPKVAISYSAGVDSNLVLTLLRKIRPDIKIELYTMMGSELDLATQLHEKYKLADRIHPVNPESVLLNIQKYVKMTGEPRWNVYHHVIAEAAKRDGNVLLLTGDGADELFGGYVFRYSKFMKDIQTKGFGTAYMGGHQNDWLILQDFFLKNFEWSMITGYLKKFESPLLTPLEQCMFADFNGKLTYDFIPTTRAIQNWHGIKISSPFLDKRVIDYALRIDAETKLTPDFSTGKLQLRELLEKNKVVVSNEKIGFTYNLVSDWNQKKHRSISIHPDTFDYIDYRWWERNGDEESDYRTINKLYQVICLSEYFKLRDKITI
jgi:asparagine synthetase B (glutamine-hydrolysing)